jgi:uncharacterized protein YndB with AHSA1/START domain
MFAGPDRREIRWKGTFREVIEPERLVFTISDQPGDEEWELVINPRGWNPDHREDGVPPTRPSRSSIGCLLGRGPVIRARALQDDVDAVAHDGVEGRPQHATCRRGDLRDERDPGSACGGPRVESRDPVTRVTA